jgi:two-component system OmpR family sensor kinase
VSSVPVRIRVAAAFAASMALVLAGAGYLVYTRVGDDLSRALDQDLRLRAQDVGTLLSDPRVALARQSPGRLIEKGESFAQLLDESGAVIDATPPIGRTALIDLAEVRRSADRGAAFVDTPSVPGLDEPARLLVTRIERGGTRRLLIVGATRENRAETLSSLRKGLLIAGPIALFLATGLGYLLAGAALRAVEVMRTHAARISADRPGERLPVPRTGDELQRLGETLNDMLARLEDALERERGFVAEAGHELRAPLALLRAELDYALHYAHTEEELRAALRTASQETDRLVQLAGDLLLIASAEQGRLPLRLETVTAADLLESIHKRFAWRAQAEGRTFEIVAPDELPVRIDRLRVEQALGNLVDNALRYGAGTVRLEARPVGHNLELHVRDAGPGFPEEYLPHAFRRFSRGDDSRSSEGTGLGLAIVATIATAHGGAATASNVAAGGADVVISVPMGTARQLIRR